MVLSWIATVLRRAGADFASILLLEISRPLGFERSTGFLGTGGAGFRITLDVEEAILDNPDCCLEEIADVLPPLWLLSNGTLASGSKGGGSMRIGPFDAGFGPVCCVLRSAED